MHAIMVVKYTNRLILVATRSGAHECGGVVTHMFNRHTNGDSDGDDSEEDGNDEYEKNADVDGDKQNNRTSSSSSSSSANNNSSRQTRGAKK